MIIKSCQDSKFGDNDKQDQKRAEVRLFFDEYRQSIAHVSQAIKCGGYACYVVGNRTVKGVQLPMHRVTRLLFEKNGFEHVTTIPRNIPNKRMPSKNSPSNVTGVVGSTMAKENIVIMCKQNKKNEPILYRQPRLLEKKSSYTE